MRIPGSFQIPDTAQAVWQNLNRFFYILDYGRAATSTPDLRRLNKHSLQVLPYILQ